MRLLLIMGRSVADSLLPRLKEDGVFVDLRREEGMIHGFFWTPAVIDRGREMLDELGSEIGKILREP